MGVLLNAAHERFCQAVHDHMVAGDSRGSARTKAYRETIAVGKGKNANDPDNARRLSNLPHVKERIQQIVDDAAKVAGITKAWALVNLRSYVDSDPEAEFSPVAVRDRISAIKLIGDMQGYMAPQKVANTDTAGNDLPPISDADRAAALAAFLAKTQGATA